MNTVPIITMTGAKSTIPSAKTITMLFDISMPTGRAISSSPPQENGLCTIPVESTYLNIWLYLYKTDKTKKGPDEYRQEFEAHQGCLCFVYGMTENCNILRNNKKM